MYSEQSFASLVDDISNSLYNLQQRGHDYDNDKEEYDPKFDDLPQELWQEQQNIQRLRLLEERRERLNELYWAYEEIYKRTQEEIEQLENELA